VTDTATNKVYSFHATGLNTNDYYASVGSLKAFGQVDPTTGAFTPLLSAKNAPDVNFASPHGVSFTADPALLANYIASSFAPTAAWHSGNVIADAHAETLVLAQPTHPG
jgi:hypothetical protein